MAITVIPFPVQYVRQQAAPIDVDSVFATTADRLTYLTSPRRYAGQIVSDLQDGNAYKLTADRVSWEAIGAGGGGGSDTLSIDFLGGQNGTVPADNTSSFTFDNTAIVDLRGRTLIQFAQEGSIVSKISRAGGNQYITFTTGTGVISWTNGTFSAGTLYSLLYK